ncbi:hypothetical protein [Halalkalicoccus tibetensis]|uniref:Pentapeptide repeat-containing protein n=1 Tax=Halalkalicoccus tibetensis TaxID=175632 RepID=A0ABD5V333_9EURY
MIIEGSELKTNAHALSGAELHNATIDNSVVFDNATIEDSEIDHSLIDCDARVKSAELDEALVGEPTQLISEERVADD